MNNSELRVPVYTEQDLDTLGDKALYPHSTAFLRYDKHDHMFYLTQHAFSKWGIAWDKIADPTGEFLARIVTEHIYTSIDVLAQVKRNDQYYRMAKGWLHPSMTPRSAYREIERMFARQAKHVVQFGDARNTPKMVVNPETGRTREQHTGIDDCYWLEDSVFAWLESRYLTDPNIEHGLFTIHWAEF